MEHAHYFCYTASTMDCVSYVWTSWYLRLFLVGYFVICGTGILVWFLHGKRRLEEEERQHQARCDREQAEQDRRQAAYDLVCQQRALLVRLLAEITPPTMSMYQTLRPTVRKNG